MQSAACLRVATSKSPQAQGVSDISLGEVTSAVKRNKLLKAVAIGLGPRSEWLRSSSECRLEDHCPGNAKKHEKKQS